MNDETKNISGEPHFGNQLCRMATDYLVQENIRILAAKAKRNAEEQKAWDEHFPPLKRQMENAAQRGELRLNGVVCNVPTAMLRQWCTENGIRVSFSSAGGGLIDYVTLEWASDQPAIPRVPRVPQPGRPGRGERELGTYDS